MVIRTYLHHCLALQIQLFLGLDQSNIVFSGIKAVNCDRELNIDLLTKFYNKEIIFELDKFEFFVIYIKIGREDLDVIRKIEQKYGYVIGLAPAIRMIDLRLELDKFKTYRGYNSYYDFLKIDPLAKFLPKQNMTDNSGEKIDPEYLKPYFNESVSP